MTIKRCTIIAAVSLLAAAPIVNAHTWVEYLYQIGSNGAFTGEPGYPIGYIPRSQGVSDDVHQNKILDTSTNPVVCKPLSSSSSEYPPLKAAAGDYIAMQYQENGHVTQPEQTVRPYRGGNVYVYGTLEHEDTDGINDVLNAWTVDGKGGNKKGKLIATHYFDDDQCFQNAPGNKIHEERKAKYGVDELFCQTDVQLPADLPSEGTYTLMWVWNWPRIISDTQNVTEIYSTCAQIELGGKDKSGSAVSPTIKFGKNNKIQSAAIPSQLEILIEATALGVGTQSPPAPTWVTQPTGTGSAAPAPTTTSSKKDDSKGDGKGFMKTVTVTAEAETITQYHTVTMGNDDEGPSATVTETPTVIVTATTTETPTKQTEVSTATAFPTSLVPVTTVQGFLGRRARVTGQLRRTFFYH